MTQRWNGTRGRASKSSLSFTPAGCYAAFDGLGLHAEALCGLCKGHSLHIFQSDHQYLFQRERLHRFHKMLAFLRERVVKLDTLKAPGR